MSSPAKVLSLLLVSVIVLAPLSRALDGNMGDPFCNVRVATAVGYRGYKHAPRDIERVQALFTKAGIKSQLAQSGRTPDAHHHTITDWFLYVYPPDAPKARHLVEGAKQQRIHVEPDYTPPTPVLQ